MARKRMIDPEFFLDEGLAFLSPHARLLYVGLWGICDDNYATLPNRPDWIKAQIFPYEAIDTRGLLDELSASSKILLFIDEDKEYWYIKNFMKYQRVDRPSKPKFPQYNEAKLVNPRRGLAEASTNTRPEVKLSKVKLSKEKREVNILSQPPFFARESITEDILQEISDKYGGHTPGFPSFVRSKFDDLCNWEDEKPGRMRGRNWKATLMNWVKRDSLEIRKEAKHAGLKTGIDARGVPGI